MLVKTFGSAVHGVSTTTVTVEVNIAQEVIFLLSDYLIALLRKASNALMLH
jgi:hypothetical protein